MHRSQFNHVVKVNGWRAECTVTTLRLEQGNSEFSEFQKSFSLGCLTDGGERFLGQFCSVQAGRLPSGFAPPALSGSL